MEFFKRQEQKYILSETEYDKVLKLCEKYIEPDIYHKSTIFNIYLDNEYDELINKSINRPVFKQKIRLRSYNKPGLNDLVFLELKGKFKETVFKRRVQLKLTDFYKYMDTGIIPDVKNKQIMKEIDYLIKFYNLKPKIFLRYDRTCYIEKNNRDFRITFDNNLRSRINDLRLENEEGKLYSNENFYIMEIKANGGIPLWFTDILSSIKLYRESFSKIGKIYLKLKEENYV